MDSIYLPNATNLINKLEVRESRPRGVNQREVLTEPRYSWPSLLGVQNFSFVVSFVASELLFEVVFDDMEIWVGRGVGRRRPVANAEVLGMLQRVEARMDVIEWRQTRDLEDISEPETEEAKEIVEISP